MKKLALLFAGLCLPALATNIAFTDSNIRAFGGAPCTGVGCTNAFTPSGAIYFAPGLDAEIDFSVNIGTNTLQTTFCGTANIKLSIDGAAATTITPPGACGSPTLKTLSNSLTPGTHTVKIWVAASDSQFSSTAAFVTDGSGTVASATNGTFFGVGKTATPFVTYGQILDNPWQATAGQDGYAGDWPLAYDNTGFGQSSTEAGIRYYSTGSTIQSIYVYAPTNTSWFLFVDGIYNTTVNILPSGGGFQLLTVTGLDAGQHLYEWGNDNILDNIGGLVYVMPGAGGALDAKAVIPQNCIGVYGDSIAAIAHPTSGSTRYAWSEATRAAGFCLMRMGIGARRVGLSAFGSNYFLRDNTGAITGGANGVPSIVLLEGGVNDMFDYDGVTYTPAEFQSAYLTQLNNMATGMAANGMMLTEQILPTTITNFAQRPNYNAAIIAATASYNASKINNVTACTFNTDFWIVPGTDTDDGLHPDLSNPPSADFPWGNPLHGYGKITTRLSFVFAGYGTAGASVTLTGPAGGPVGQVSTNFTIAPVVSGAVFSGETITPSDGAGGTFTPSTVTLTAATNSATFTYTPSLGGVKSISLTSLPNCWTVPPSLTYTSLATSSTVTGGASVTGGVSIQ